MRLAASLALACGFANIGCGKATESQEPANGAAVLPTAPKVTDDGGPFVLRYFAPTTGNLLVARKVAEVPEAARGQVLVSPDDPALQGPWLFVADLTRKGADGTSYEVRTVDRFELERQVVAAQPAPNPPAAGAALGSAGGAAVGPATAPTGGPAAILYKTSWCGYCRKAAEYMRLKGIPFVERDIERDASARADMVARARQAGVPESSLGGVPVIWIKGRVLSGFSREAIDRAWTG